MMDLIAGLREQVRVLTEALAGLLGRFVVQCEEGWRCAECGVVLSGHHCSEGCEVGAARAALVAAMSGEGLENG